MQQHILLTGGSGLLGQHLTTLLLAKGYRVSHLSRKPGAMAGVNTFLWDVDKGIIDENCLNGVDTLVHLAGAPIAQRWTDEHKKTVIESRTKSIGLVYQLMSKKAHQVSTIISASGIGYYSDRGDELMREDSAPAHDFLGECCILWEQAVDEGADLVQRIVKFRTGVVLDAAGGALPQLALPVKLGVGSPIGSGKQWVSWLHWRDAVDMYIYGIETPALSGAFNMAAPNPLTNAQLTKAIAKQLHRPLWLPKIPGFVMKLLFGEMSTLILGSTKASAKKIEESGFVFKYPEIEAALKEIYG